MQTKKNVFNIAEAGVNHNGRLDLALDLVSAAAETGANAVKFQTFKADRLASKNLEKAHYQKVTTGEDESQYAMLEKLELPEAWHFELKSFAKKLGIEFLSTAFDLESLHFLQTLNLPLYKVPSGELTNAPLLWHFAKTKKPLIVSTGMATLSEVEQGLAIINHALHNDDEPKTIDDIWASWSNVNSRELLKKTVTLLHCTSQYPAPWEEVNLRAMDTLAQTFGIAVGYSCHTLGNVIPIAAVARGAVVIEKHLTLDRMLPGPDHKASLEVAEFKKMVDDIRALEVALGDGVKAPQASELEIRKIVRQSIIAAQALPIGKVIHSSDITTARIGHGLSPAYYWNLLGTVTKKSYEQGEKIAELID